MDEITGLTTWRLIVELVLLLVLARLGWIVYKPAKKTEFDYLCAWGAVPLGLGGAIFTSVALLIGVFL